MEEKAPDRDCVERCLRGDSEAFGPLVEKYQRPVFRAVLTMVGNYEDARELTQQVFLKAFQHLAAYDPGRKFFSWIYRIAINESINHLKARRPVEPLEGDPGETGPRVEPIEAEDRARSVRQAVQTLGEEYRAVIVLRHFLDLSYSEVAEALRLPVSTVKSRLFDARRMLRSRLAPAGEGRSATR